MPQWKSQDLLKNSNYFKCAYLTKHKAFVILHTDRWSVWRCGMARNKYPEETMKLILDVATHLFVEKGYDATSLQDIINETNLSKGAI